MAEDAAPQAERVRRFPCRGCGADVEFVPHVGLQCPYCGHVAGIPQNADHLIEELSFEEYLCTPGRPRGYGVASGRDMNCKGCGAVTHVTSDAASARCAYCGAPVVLEESADEGVVRPEAVLPFQITKQEALDRFSTWVNSLWWAPGELKRLRETDRIAGLYRPYWTFDAATHSFYTGERGEHYWETEYYTDAQGRRCSRSVCRTRWYPASGQVSSFFDDVLVTGCRPLGWETPYELAELCPYDPGYLSGWQAERYSVTPEKAWPTAQKVIDEGIGELVRERIGGDEQRIESIRTDYTAIKFKHILLPLYLATYFYAGKTYRFQVNGATGEVKGERPYSFWKITLAILVVLAMIAAAVALLGR